MLAGFVDYGFEILIRIKVMKYIKHDPVSLKMRILENCSIALFLWVLNRKIVFFVFADDIAYLPILTTPISYKCRDILRLSLP